MQTERVPSTREEIELLFDAIKTWGRWGPEDERGALNYITPETRRAAAALVREGVTVSAALPLAKTPSAENPTPVMHLMLRAGDLAVDSSAGARMPSHARGSTSTASSADYFAIASHGMANTHLDALSHIFHNGQMYNGFPASLVTSAGALALSIEAGRDGIVSRGVLLDVPRANGRDWLEPGEAIFPADLETAEAMSGVRVESGDILLVRTGRHLRKERIGFWNGRETLAGLHAACLPWLAERQVAVLGCDGVSDVLPSGVEGVGLPIHLVGIVGLGIHLIDNCDLEALGSVCAERGRWTFLLTLAPLRLEHGTASPVNPIALF